MIVPSISADFTISSGNDDRLLKLSYEDNPALMQGPGEEIPGINTSHAIHRLNFLQPKADSGAKPASVWGQSCEYTVTIDPYCNAINLPVNTFSSRLQSIVDTFTAREHMLICC